MLSPIGLSERQIILTTSASGRACTASNWRHLFVNGIPAYNRKIIISAAAFRFIASFPTAFVLLVEQGMRQCNRATRNAGDPYG